MTKVQKGAKLKELMKVHSVCKNYFNKLSEI